MNTNKKTLEAIKGNLIVSCQALPDEPLHSPFIMGRMAKAACEGGAKGIRANGVADIQAIKESVQLPIIGIIKEVYDNSEVYITPTEKEIELLHEEGVDIIAVDATTRIRPNGETINTFFPKMREKYPNQLFMADCSTFEDGKNAYKLGFDLVGTTLSSYTDETKGQAIPNFNLVKAFVKELPIPIIAEGGIWSPEQLKKMFDIGVYTAVVGSVITRPQLITRKFVNVLEHETE